MEYGYVKRGRGYGQVEIQFRHKLPKVEAVRWRFLSVDEWGDEVRSEWFTTESVRVLAVKPLTGSQTNKLGRQTIEASRFLLHEWRPIGKWNLGQWNKLKVNPLLELRRERLSDKVWQWQARRKNT